MKRKFQFVFVSGVLIALFYCGVAAAFDRFEIVSIRELVQLLKEREAGNVDFLLVNSLDEIIFRDAHIPGSINIPLTRMEQFVSRLGSDRKKLIITY